MDAAFDYPSIQKFKDAGFKFIVCPAVWNFTGPFPNFYNSYANILYFTREGYKAGSVGVIVSTWNDNGAAELSELNYPGVCVECRVRLESGHMTAPTRPTSRISFSNQIFSKPIQIYLA